MALSKDFADLTEGLSAKDHCPLCDAWWPLCFGACVQHGGPFHDDYSDDCDECAADRLEAAEKAR